MTTENIVPIAFIAALLAYPTFLWFWIRVMRPIRMQFADEGARLLRSPDIDDGQKELIDKFLDDAFDWKFSIIAFFVFLPAVATKAILRRTGHAEGVHIPELHDLYENPEAERFLILHAKCALGSNPFFALLFFVEALMVFLAVAILHRSLTHGMQFIERSIAWLAAKTDDNHKHAH